MEGEMHLRRLLGWGLALCFALVLGVAPTAALAEEDDGQTGEEQPADTGSLEDLDESAPPPSDVIDPEPADDSEGETDAEPEEKEKKSLIDMYTDSEPAFGEYGRWIRHQEKLLLEADLWGASATVPEGYLLFTVGWATLRPYKRFDEDRKLVDILPIIEFDDPFNGQGKFLEFDFGIRGKGMGFLAGVMYGITDQVMFSVFTQFLRTEVKFDPIFTPGTVDKLGVASLEDFYQVLELLGRPRPVTKYKTDGVDWGDTTLSIGWNYYRGKVFAGTWTTNIFLPTAHQANPNENLTFGLGADIDTGNGAWGVGVSLPFDFRPPAPFDIVTFSITGEAAYYLPAPRRSPKFLPIAQDVRDYIESQGVEVDLFQDLTDMDSTYMYTPGPWAAGTIGVGVGPVSISYRHGWGWEADFDSNSPGFKKMIDEIGLVGNGDDGKLIFAVSLPLTPLYIPALAQFRFEYQTDGRNTLVYRDNYGLGLGIALPVGVPDRYKMKKGGK